MKVAHISARQRILGLFSGLALVIVGVLIQTKFQVYLAFFGTRFNPVAILLLVLGSIVFILGFFGCCRAYRTNYFFVMAFATLLASVLVLEIVAVIVACLLKRQVQLFIESQLRVAMESYSTSGDIKEAWDVTQRQFLCCGVTSYLEWSSLGVFDSSNQTVPSSCRCKPSDPSDVTPPQADLSNVVKCGANFQIINNSTDPIYINTKGCVPAFVSWYESSVVETFCAGAAISLVQIAGVFLACTLAGSIKRECGDI